MSSKKRARVAKWDREKGRRTLYFSKEELAILLKASEKVGLNETDFLKSIFRRYITGRLVIIEKVEAYKTIIDKLVAAGKKSPDVPVYGKEDALETQDSKTSAPPNPRD